MVRLNALVGKGCDISQVFRMLFPLTAFLNGRTSGGPRTQRSFLWCRKVLVTSFHFKLCLHRTRPTKVQNQDVHGQRFTRGCSRRRKRKRPRDAHGV